MTRGGGGGIQTQPPKKDYIIHEQSLIVMVVNFSVLIGFLAILSHSSNLQPLTAIYSNLQPFTASPAIYSYFQQPSHSSYLQHLQLFTVI